jgi:hypothetical protein
MQKSRAHHSVETIRHVINGSDVCLLFITPLHETQLTEYKKFFGSQLRLNTLIIPQSLQYPVPPQGTANNIHSIHAICIHHTTSRHVITI